VTLFPFNDPASDRIPGFLTDYSSTLVPSNATQRMYNIQFILFYFIKIKCFDHFIRSSPGEYKMYKKCSLELQTTLRQDGFLPTVK
jgi:hypothetical protein